MFLHDRYIQASCLPYVYSRSKVLITAQNVGEIVRHIHKKLAANTLNLSRVSYNKVFNRLRVFVHSLMSINFSAFRNIFTALLGKMDFFPIFRTTLAVNIW